MGKITGVLVKVVASGGDDYAAEIHKVIIEGNFEGIGEAIHSPMIEPFYLQGCHGYCDEEGKLNNKPVNVAATAIAQHYGFTKDDVLCGDVIFLGEDEDGNEVDLPQPILNEIVEWRDGK